jgi:hypothetical protein
VVGVGFLAVILNIFFKFKNIATIKDTLTKLGGFCYENHESVFFFDGL